MDLVQLDPDHPGFRDRVYRERRNRIAALANAHRTGSPIPEVRYSEAEHEVWRSVVARLSDLHGEKACRALLELQRGFPLPVERVPQLAEITGRLAPRTGFRMEPVGGLVVPRCFFEALARRVFLSTQYVRHPSRPYYTPEPDIIHELVGHAATLAHPGIAELNRLLGAAASVADPARLKRIERVYWFTLEFGVVEEDGRLKALGAGLLSSVGELDVFERHARFEAWDLERMAATVYDPTDLQGVLFVAPSFERLLADVSAWAGPS